ncbi:MAG: DNA-processing protein DprA [Candidatus Eremiobacterota bacterium]
MDELVYWLALTNVSNLGILKSRKLLEVFLSPRNIFNASPSDIGAVKGIGSTIVCSIKEKDRLFKEAEEEIEKTTKKGISIISLSDKSYPSLLKEIPDPPLVLYVKGNLTDKDRNSVAVIGTRTPDSYGKSVAFDMCKKLATFNFTVVSGMARGIDTIAHRGALNAHGRTIAVIGCGLDIAYPPENYELMDMIAANGAVISEFPLGTEPLSCNFPKRNRIISGLSRGILVVQAREKSGTFHTVNSALEQGREVFAIPGSIDKELSRGTHRLIKEGAKLVEDIGDITGELIPMEGFPLPEKPPEPVLSEDEKKIYLYINMEGTHIDEIIRKTSMETGRVSSVLSILELKNLIIRREGNFFVRI